MIRAAIGGAAIAAVLAAWLPANAQPTPAPFAGPGAIPTLAPVSPGEALPTLAPANSGTPLPYPAFGTPAPGQSPTAVPGIPQTITLQQAVAIAAARSPALAAARGDAALAAAPLKAASLAFFPAISGTASTTRNYSQQSGAIPSATATPGVRTFGSGWSTSNSVGASLRQTIFDGGKLLAQLRSAQANAVAGLDTYRRAAQTLSYNVANAYYSALEAARATQVAVETLRLDETQEALVVAQYRVGAAARTDIVTAQLPVAQARLALVRAQGTELTAYAQLANTIGIDANADVRPADNPSDYSTAGVQSIPVPAYDTALKRAYALRPDYEASQKDVSASKYNLRVARLGLFPTITGGASMGSSSTDPQGGTFRNASSLGLTLSVPIFDQGYTAANIASAQASLAIAQANLDNTDLGLQLSVKQGLIGLISARGGVDQANVELLKAAEVLHATQAQYKAGVTTLPLLLNAQVGYTTALTDQATAVYTLRQAEQAFELATGEIAY